MGNEHSTCGGAVCCTEKDHGIQESNSAPVGPSSWGQMAVSRSSHWDEVGESPCLIPAPPKAKLNRWLDAQAVEVEKSQKIARDQILQKQKDAVQTAEIQRQVETLQAAVVARRESGLEEMTLGTANWESFLSGEEKKLGTAKRESGTEEMNLGTSLGRSSLKGSRGSVSGEREVAFRTSINSEHDIEEESSNSNNSVKPELTEQELLLERLSFYQQRFKFKMESIEEEAADTPLSGIPVEKAITSLAEWVGRKPVRKSEFTLAMLGIAAEADMSNTVDKKHIRRVFSVLDFDDINVLHHSQWVSSFPFFFCTKEDFFECLFEQLNPTGEIVSEHDLHVLEKYVIPVVQMLIPPDEQELREELVANLATTVFNAVDEYVDGVGELRVVDIIAWSRDGSVSECAVHCLREILGLEGFEKLKKYTVPKELADEENNSQEYGEHIQTAFTMKDPRHFDKRLTWQIQAVPGDTLKEAEDADRPSNNHNAMRKRYSILTDELNEKMNTEEFTALKRMSSVARKRKAEQGESESPTMDECLDRFRKHIGAICTLADKCALSEIPANTALKFFASSVGIASLDVHEFMNQTRYLAAHEGIQTRVTEKELLDLFTVFNFDDKESLPHSEWVALTPLFFTVNAPIHDEVFGELDVDDTGGLSEKELAKYCTPLVQMLIPPKDKVLRQKLLDQLSEALFDEIDLDEDGNLTPIEFEKWFYKDGNVAELAFSLLEEILTDEMRQGLTSNQNPKAPPPRLTIALTKKKANKGEQKHKGGNPSLIIEDDSIRYEMTKINSRAFSLHDDLDISTCIMTRTSHCLDEIDAVH